MNIISLIAGFILDTLLGDPHYLPHPVRLFGKSISLFDKILNRGKKRKVKGFVTVLLLVSVTYATFHFIMNFAGKYDFIRPVLASVFVFYGIANRGLITEGLKVERVLKSEGVLVARKQLSLIVGRDTTELSDNEIRTAVLETLAENLSDGVIAPLFYYAIGGIPLMMSYKMINTMDSMIGYKNEQYRGFGFFAARLDDVLNLIPSRLTAFLMVLVTLNRRGLKFIFRYGNKHTSPNAGYPEAALAGILNCRLGGPNIYQGKKTKKPYIGNNNRRIKPEDIHKACMINAAVTIVFILGIIFVYFIYKV